MADPVNVSLNIPKKAPAPSAPAPSAPAPSAPAPSAPASNANAKASNVNAKPSNANSKPSAAVVEVVKAANLAVNNSSAKKVADLLEDPAVVKAAQNLVNKLSHKGTMVGGRRTKKAKSRKSRSTRR